MIKNNFLKISIHSITKLALSFCILISSSLFTVSCNEDDLDQATADQLSEVSFWKTNTDALAGVIAIYQAMLDHYERKHIYYGEFRGDGYTTTDSARGEVLNLVENAMQSTDQDIVEWTLLYRMIARANTAIKNIPNIQGFDEGVLSEAYALRAYAYFDIVRVWGAAPVFTEPVTSLSDNLSRPPVDGAQILQDIVIPDMLEAERLAVISSAKFRFSKTSILALQANVYMWIKDYEKAQEKLTELVNSSEFSLVTSREDWRKMFLNDSDFAEPDQDGPELILSLDYTLATSERAGVFSLYNTGINSALIAARVENKWLAEYPDNEADWIARYPDPADLPKTDDGNGNLIYGDWRYLESRTDDAIGEARVAKWNKNPINGGLDDTDLVLYRLPDMILMLAEAENQLDNPGEAYSLLNRVRNARQLPNFPQAEWDGLSKVERETELLKERQFELLGEAKRWWDLRRTGRAVDVMGPINGLTEERLVFPYFINHVLENIELDQIEAYR